MQTQYSAMLYYQDHLCQCESHTSLDSITARLMLWLQEASLGSEGVIYDHATDCILSRHARTSIE